MLNKTKKVIGDKGASDRTLYSVPITVEEAARLATSLLAELNVPAQVKVRYGRKTRKRCGTIEKAEMANGQQYFLIRLNSQGLNVGTVLHELAHIDRQGELIEGHPDRFRNGLKLYTEVYKKLFPVPEMMEDPMGVRGFCPESGFPPKMIEAGGRARKPPEGLVNALCRILLGERMPLDVLNSKTGKVIIPANCKINRTRLYRMAANADHVEMCPSPIRVKIMSIIDAFR